MYIVYYKFFIKKVKNLLKQLKFCPKSSELEFIKAGCGL